MTGFATLGPWTDGGDRAAGVILTDRHRRVCLQLRDDFAHVAGGGNFGFFGGMVEPGETLAAAACREIEEELGLSLSPDALHPFARTLSETGQRIHVFTTPDPVFAHQLRLAEGAGFAFLTEAQTATLPLLPATARVLQRFFGTTRL